MKWWPHHQDARKRPKTDVCWGHLQGAAKPCEPEGQNNRRELDEHCMHCRIKWSVNKETYGRHIDVAGPPLHQVCYVNKNCPRNVGDWNELSSPVQNLKESTHSDMQGQKYCHVHLKWQKSILNLMMFFLTYTGTHLQSTLWTLEEQSDATIIRVFTTAQLIFLHTCAVHWRVVQSP